MKALVNPTAGIGSVRFQQAITGCAHVPDTVLQQLAAWPGHAALRAMACLSLVNGELSSGMYRDNQGSGSVSGSARIRKYSPTYTYKGSDQYWGLVHEMLHCIAVRHGW